LKSNFLLQDSELVFKKGFVMVPISISLLSKASFHFANQYLDNSGFLLWYVPVWVPVDPRQGKAEAEG
jgi:hypothetical protein